MLQALVWNLGSCRSDVKGATKQRTCESLSTEAEHSGGVIHSSGETAVIVVERRYDLIQLKDGDNCETG